MFDFQLSDGSVMKPLARAFKELVELLMSLHDVQAVKTIDTVVRGRVCILNSEIGLFMNVCSQTLSTTVHHKLNVCK